MHLDAYPDHWQDHQRAIKHNTSVIQSSLCTRAEVRCFIFILWAIVFMGLATCNQYGFADLIHV